MNYGVSGAAAALLAGLLGPLGPALAASGDDLPVEIAIYGDVLYSRYRYGPDQKSGANGAPADRRATMDLAHLVGTLEYAVRPDLEVEIEVEFEHGGTGSALELEYEEFGEYELEVEHGGEIVVEELHLTQTFGRSLRLRAGHFLTAVGLANRSHEPTAFFPTSRAEAERNVIPTTWDETGVEVFGDIGRFAYRAQVVNALDSSGFGSQFWIVGGKQGRFEGVRATDLAFAGRLDARVGAGSIVGLSFYRGDTTGNRPKPDMEGIDAPVTLVDAHAILKRGPLRGRGMFLRGTLANAALVSSKNGRLSTALSVPRTPVAKEAVAWYAELGYDVASLLLDAPTWKLYPFVHYGRYNTMAEVDDGIFPDPRFDRRLLTVGLDLFPDDDVVVKLDYSHRSFGADRLRSEDTWSLDVGFATELFD